MGSTMKPKPPATCGAPRRGPPRSAVRLLPGLLCCALAAPTVAQQDAAPAPAAAAADAAAPLPQGRALLPTELEHLERFTLEKGTSVPLPKTVVAALKMTPRQVAPTVRQSAFVENDDLHGGTRHGFALLNDDSGFFLFRRDPKSGVSVFHIDRRFRLIAAAHEFQGGRFLETDEVVALKELDAEIETWARVLTPGGAPVVLPKPARQAPSSKAPAP